MDVRRLRFIAALVLFLAWVAALGTMALLSGRRPALRPATAPQDHSGVLIPGVLTPGSSEEVAGMGQLLGDSSDEPSRAKEGESGTGH